MNQSFKDYLLELTVASSCKELEVIQTLWSGYGKICRYQLLGSDYNTVVVKYISLKEANEHPRGWNTDLSHNRKVQSYQVETHWYEQWNEKCNSNCRTPKYIGSFVQEDEQWIVLEDLDREFPLRKEAVVINDVKVCLKWLANFHATFLTKEPIGLWEQGTYWHLSTRPDEFKKLEHEELKAKAKIIDEKLNHCQYKTVVHGDAKLANFCFSESGNKVAAVDFQYVGGGCGMKDVAYLLGSCLSNNDCSIYQNELLDFYFGELKESIVSTGLKIDVKEIVQEWRNLYPIACADFTRFLLGWMPSHQKINEYQLSLLEAVLSRL